VFATEVTLVALMFGSAAGAGARRRDPDAAQSGGDPAGDAVQQAPEPAASWCSGFAYVLLALVVPWVADRRQQIRSIAIIRSPVAIERDEDLRRSA
jgi:hypothetical protein